MTQPAKVQEPSMEEILASIRRIIADDEAKPPAAEKAPEPPKAEKPAAAPAAAKPAMGDIPPSKIPAAVAAAAKAPPPPAPPPAAPVPASNSQDDIDALLAGLDESTSAEEVRPAHIEPEPEPEPEVLELTDDMAVAPPPAPAPAPVSFRKVEPQDDIEFIDPSAARAAPRSPSFEQSFDTTPPRQPILGQNTVNAVESAFNALANTVLSNNARTLEDLVKEMLRPMLKSWLDDNLPALVERIVKAEIERVSRGR